MPIRKSAAAATAAKFAAQKTASKNPNFGGKWVHFSLCSAWISPSPPQRCGGEGWGEEAILKKPLSLSLSPLARSEGMEIAIAVSPFQ